MPEAALAGVTVFDLSEEIAGPYCTKLLADYGADVIKVERPGGDPTRRMGPFYHDDPHPEKSGLFLHLNANKRSITLDLESSTGRRILLELLKQADVLVESFAPGVMASLGLGYDVLGAARPSLVMTSLSPFGQTGPYRDYKSSEIVTYAMGGPMYATGLPDREPIKLGGNVLQYQAGATAATATAIALWTAEGTGQGEYLDISLMRVQASSQDRRTTMLVAYQYTGHVSERVEPGTGMAQGTRPCADGYINMSGGGARLGLVAQMLGEPELMQDPRFRDEMARAVPGRAEEFDEYLIPWLLQYTKQEAFQLAQEHHVPSGPIYDCADLLADPYFHGRRYWTPIQHPSTGTVLHTGRPFIMTESPWRIRRPAPALGQHNREVLCGLLGFSQSELAQLRQSGAI